METSEHKSDLTDALGSGSYSSVYLGYSKKDNKKVAIKEIKNDSKQKGYFSESASKEFSAMKKANGHVNIVQLLEFHSTVRYIYIIMKFCELGDLENYAQNQTLTLECKQKVMMQIANGVTYLHNMEPPIIHRDLKPQNILMTQTTQGDTVKISDFGLSKVLEDENKKDYMSTDAGSPKFHAPELFDYTDGRLQYTSAVDVFALGLVYLVLLKFDENTNATFDPYDNPDEPLVVYGAKLLHCRRKQEPFPTLFHLTSEETSITADIKALICKMVTYEPKSRPLITEVSDELKIISESSQGQFPTANSDYQANIAENQLLISKLNKDIHRLQADNETLRRDNQEVTTSMAQYQSTEGEMKRLKAENKTLEDIMQSSLEAQDEKDRQIKELQRKLTNSKEASEEKGKKITELEHQVTSLSAQLKQQQKLIKDSPTKEVQDDEKDRQIKELHRKLASGKETSKENDKKTTWQKLATSSAAEMEQQQLTKHSPTTGKKETQSLPKSATSNLQTRPNTRYLKSGQRSNKDSISLETTSGNKSMEKSGFAGKTKATSHSPTTKDIGKTETKSFNSHNRFKGQTESISLDSNIRVKGETEPKSLDSNIRVKGQTKSKSLDSNIRVKGQTEPKSLDSSIGSKDDIKFSLLDSSTWDKYDTALSTSISKEINETESRTQSTGTTLKDESSWGMSIGKDKNENECALLDSGGKVKDYSSTGNDSSTEEDEIGPKEVSLNSATETKGNREPTSRWHLSPLKKIAYRNNLVVTYEVKKSIHVSCCTMKIAHERLYCTTSKRLHVYNLDGERFSTISFNYGGNKAWASVSLANSDQFIVADENKGVFLLNKYGSCDAQLSDGSFCDLQQYQDKVYALEYKKLQVFVFESAGQSWTKSHSINLSQHDMFSSSIDDKMCVNNDKIYRTSWRNHSLCMYDMNGTLLSTHGQLGETEGMHKPGLLNFPYLCHVDDSGTALIADCHNNRLQICTATGEWQVITLPQEVYCPTYALVNNNSIWIASSWSTLLKLCEVF